MIKHVIAGISTLLAIWAFIHLYTLDKEVNKLQRIAEIIEKTKMEVKLSDKNKIQQEVKQEQKNVKQAKKKDEMAEKLKALKERAGNMSAFKVSPLYKKNCSSCHGTIGEGIIGPKLIGRSKDYILKNLEDFKSGKRKNYVMYGLLGNLDEQQLNDLAEEIASFEAKLEAANK